MNSSHILLSLILIVLVIALFAQVPIRVQMLWQVYWVVWMWRPPLSASRFAIWDVFSLNFIPNHSLWSQSIIVVVQSIISIGSYQLVVPCLIIAHPKWVGSYRRCTGSHLWYLSYRRAYVSDQLDRVIIQRWSSTPWLRITTRSIAHTTHRDERQW